MSRVLLKCFGGGGYFDGSQIHFNFKQFQNRVPKVCQIHETSSEAALSSTHENLLIFSGQLDNLDKFVNYAKLCLMSNRTEYRLELTLNDRTLTRVINDQHYKEKHSDSVNDELILDLVKNLDGKTIPVDREFEGFQYFKAEPVVADKKPFRLILVMCICDDFLGVINAFRVQRKKL